MTRDDWIVLVNNLDSPEQHFGHFKTFVNLPQETPLLIKREILRGHLKDMWLTHGQEWCEASAEIIRENLTE